MIFLELKGGFGKVYHGYLETPTAKNGKIEVAIKELIEEEPDSPRDDTVDAETKFIEFQQEVYIMSQLSHANIVKLHGIIKKPLQMVLEFVPHGDLMNFLHPLDPVTQKRISIPKEKLPWKLRMLIALDIARGMLYLQKRNPPIIHRDLRSPNIFISSYSENPCHIRAKVADFGLSRYLFFTFFPLLPSPPFPSPPFLPFTEPNEH